MIGVGSNEGTGLGRLADELTPLGCTPRATPPLNALAFGITAGTGEDGDGEVVSSMLFRNSSTAAVGAIGEGSSTIAPSRTVEDKVGGTVVFSKSLVEAGGAFFLREARTAFRACNSSLL